LSRIVKEFEKGDPPYTSTELSNDLGIPLRIVRDILTELTSAKILNETLTESSFETGYQPALDIGKITIQFVNKKLEFIGSDQIFTNENATYNKLNEIYEGIYQMLSTAPTNMLVKDL
jgi:membrane protein